MSIQHGFAVDRSGLRAIVLRGGGEQRGERMSARIDEVCGVVASEESFWPLCAVGLSEVVEREEVCGCGTARHGTVCVCPLKNRLGER